MIITRNFVLLNFPKTGSSFARKAVKRAYREIEPRWRRAAVRMGVLAPYYEELYVPKIDEISNRGLEDQHGTWRQIPAKHRDKQIVSVTRNPLERYLSTYHFEWWRQHPPAGVEELRESYPAFPDLGFQDYFSMIQHFGCRDRLGDIVPAVPLGLHTIQFIQFFARDPGAVLQRIDQRYIEEREILNDMPDIRFLEQQRLNADLKDFLVSSGMRQDKLSWLDSMSMENVTNRGDSGADHGEIGSVVDTILELDKLIFTLFPSYLPVSPGAES